MVLNINKMFKQGLEFALGGELISDSFTQYLETSLFPRLQAAVDPYGQIVPEQTLIGKAIGETHEVAYFDVGDMHSFMIRAPRYNGYEFDKFDVEVFYNGELFPIDPNLEDEIMQLLEA